MDQDATIKAREATIAALMRAPETVMRLARLGSAHPCRLSFLRTLMRRVEREGWRFDRTLWEVDDKGVGRACYRARGPERSYTLIAFAHDLPDDMRSDRVIATAWDATFTLFDGEPSEGDLDRLAQNVPLQEAGRVSASELTLSRANRSVRLFDHVVARLAEGAQPDPAEIEAVGYLMRTTAVYGSGKFGAADRATIATRSELAAPFQAEMLTVWLIREFTFDIVEHLARERGGARAARLDPVMRHGLGVGNSTGLGMAPFLVKHPLLLNNWILARETALARVLALPHATPQAIARFGAALAAAEDNARTWRSDHPIQIDKLAELRADLAQVGTWLGDWAWQANAPWAALWQKAKRDLGLEGQEALVSLLIEPHGELVDDLADQMAADEAIGARIDGAEPLGSLRSTLEADYAWALRIDFDDPANQARFWYVSEEKLEPRIGERATEAGAELEQPLCIARMAAELHAAIRDLSPTAVVAELLLQNPQHRFMVRRIQALRHAPYGEIRENLIGADVLPIDMLRCKLAFFGATHFDPRSDKWVRISLFQGAPSPFDFNREGEGC